MQVTSWLR